ncbi:uncharacterized protein CIMG_03988 [Coccidioides immitis RS]|uniref:Uncharacterized protein n=1 Tax=Coccidioides immitis (strain RS) TaxID=246410 RepID=J3KCJ7_COCIM|nr:uncharacterized protein CIMG_03988 [Coccidioides immitis RS]EAS32964.3 hypothetical protein CIMG_03988 [Coccidioides immitis RS]
MLTPGNRKGTVLKINFTVRDQLLQQSVAESSKTPSDQRSLRQYVVYAPFSVYMPLSLARCEGVERAIGIDQVRSSGRTVPQSSRWAVTPIKSRSHDVGGQTNRWTQRRSIGAKPRLRVIAIIIRNKKISAFSQLRSNGARIFTRFLRLPSADGGDVHFGYDPLHEPTRLVPSLRSSSVGATAKPGRSKDHRLTCGAGTLLAGCVPVLFACIS